MRSPGEVVRLLPGFDQYVLAPGTGDTAIVAADRRSLISKAAGWISPVVLAGGRVVGTWEVDGTTASVVLFDGAGPISPDALEAQVARVGAAIGALLTLSVRTS